MILMFLIKTIRHQFTFSFRRGPAYGYNLNMKKCVYLMAPLGRDISQRELDVRMHALINLGIPIVNIKVNPDCQFSVSPSWMSIEDWCPKED